MNRSRKKTTLLLHLLLLSVTAHLFIVSDVFGAWEVNRTVVEDDFRCLKSFKSSLKDPQGRLENWVFNNFTVGFICKFLGVTCWNEQENRLISLQLQTSELAGQIPDSLQYCGSLQNLDLSGNNISGRIPSKICEYLPFIVTLDLSRNDLSGPIPPELVNCKYLNALNLSGNRLTGPIPHHLSGLDRLKRFSVSNNDLSGEIPEYFEKFTSTDFAGNQLCGKPLGSNCGGKKNTYLIIIIVVASGVLSAVVSLLIGFAIRWSFNVRYNGRRRKTGAGVDLKN